MSQQSNDWVAVATAIQLAVDLDTKSANGLGGHTEFAANWLRTRVLRKLKPLTAEQSRSADEAALQTLLACNKRCKAWAYVCRTEEDREIDSTIRHLLWQWASGLHLGALMADCWDVGPGAIQGAAQNDIYTKLFDSTLTATNRGLYIRYLHVAQGHLTHLAAEKWRRARHSPLSIVKGSKISFVPKDSRTSRTIGTEASVNMLAQKAIASFLEARLAQFCNTKLGQQASVNRRFARAGSKTGLLATLDQSSASDHISLGFCQEFLPSDTLRALMDTRSPMFYVSKGAGHWVNCYIMSGMGNAFTFPLQTMIFRAIAVAVTRYLDLSEKSVQVFGDDVICDARAYALLVQTYQRLGFKINVEKSFSAGPFRESCGGDYYDGFDVKPVYIRSLENRFDLISAFNRLRVWSLKHGVPLFRTLLLLRRLIGAKVFYQPFPDYDAFGETSGSDPCEGIWCTRLQALRRGARLTHSGLVHYHVMTRTPIVKDIETCNIDGLVIAACSGKATPSCHRLQGDLDRALSIVPKQVQFKMKRVRRYASVWPAPDSFFWRPENGLQFRQQMDRRLGITS